MTYIDGDGRPGSKDVQGSVLARDEAQAQKRAESEARGKVAGYGSVLTVLVAVNGTSKSGSPPAERPVKPPKPEGLVARWYVTNDGRDPERDNREVILPSGARAKIVVHLPRDMRHEFRFTLKHDKRRKWFPKEDVARTALLKHGSIVKGDHEWRKRGDRIYIGDRRGVDKAFKEAPQGFYVDLVLIE